MGESDMVFNAIVHKYIADIRPRAQAELTCFQQQPTLRSAIERAALAINCQDKRFRHQCRLKQAALEEAKHALLAQNKAIGCQENFDELFNLVEKLTRSIEGIGELYVYDTSLRIAAKLNCLPTKVYLHAGTRRGAQALGLDGKAKALEVSAFPVELQQLAPHEIEDVLCIFKDKLAKAKVKQLDQHALSRSWCS
jgi:hypothetical protein